MQFLDVRETVMPMVCDDSCESESMRRWGKHKPGCEIGEGKTAFPLRVHSKPNKGDQELIGAGVKMTVQFLAAQAID